MAEKKRYLEINEVFFSDGMDSRTRNFGPVLEVKVTYHSYQNGIEAGVDFQKNDASHSRIVISRGMNMYVEELYEENEESIHYEEEPVATKHKGQPSPPSHSFSKMFVSIEQRRWNDILAVGYVNKEILVRHSLKDYD